MNTNDERLSELLQKWPALEPGPFFLQRVRNRIETARPPVAESGWLQPAFSALVAIFVALLVTEFTASPSRDDGTLSPGTISGKYVHLALGGSP